jgi:hypothetical protein
VAEVPIGRALESVTGSKQHAFLHRTSDELQANRKSGHGRAARQDNFTAEEPAFRGLFG